MIAALQARYAEETGVRALKVRHNNSSAISSRCRRSTPRSSWQAPLNATFIHRMTMAGQVRFTTTELGELEARIASAADRALGIELETFERLAAQVTAAAGPIKEAAEALAALDVAAALAQLAVERDYVRPEVDGSLDFVIEGGRHPVVEQALLARRRAVRRQRLRSVVRCREQRAPAASACSPARTWRASRRSCARTR